MIISASRRTDIPAFYSRWFFNGLERGYVDVRNPMNPRRISRVSLSPEVVDGYVFWTKNPQPMIDGLDRLSDIPYYFLFTLTPYGRDVEGLPEKFETMTAVFASLSEQIKKKDPLHFRQRIVWRYDPVFLNDHYDMDFHRRAFARLAERLSPFTDTCVISFLDNYRHIRKRMAPLGVLSMDENMMKELAFYFAETGKRFGIQLRACAEKIDLRACGVMPSACIDAGRFERITGQHYEGKKDKNQRPECRCTESVDIGAYNTCRFGCRYCYALRSEKTAAAKAAAHDPASTLLDGKIAEEDVVTLRKMTSIRIDEELQQSAKK